MSIQLQEIQSIFISQNRLVEGKDYVRAEWLKKSGLARIDIPTNYNMVDSVTCYFKHYGGTQGQMPIFGGDKIHGLLWKLWGNSSTDKSNSLDTYFNSQYFFNISATEGKFKVIFNWQAKKRLISWNDVSKGGWLNCSLDKTNTKISVFDSTRFNRSWHIHTGALAMKYFFLAPNVYLYPCQLLRDIPASLDANGIARTAGECGMVDSISGKFYGNVARSGAFTVENLVESGTVENVDESGMVEDTRLHQIYTNKLVENVDYRCYDWLERKSSAMSQMFNLTLSNTADTVVRIWNYKAQGSNGRDMIYLNNTNQSKYFIFPDNNAAGQTLMRHSDQSTSQVIATGQDVELTLRSGKVNNITTLAYNSISICPSVSSGNLTKVGRIYSDSYDYVPCKLLRAIPANRTMNGKSYPAGTMGMIEKVSKKFQPINYAATLTVSYDEWLKDCSIQFDPETTLGYNTSIPNDYVIYGRIEVAKLTAQYTDFGFMQASNNYIVLGESTVYAINDWGTNKWATFVVSYSGGGYECSLQLNGVTLTSTSSPSPYNQSPHIQLHGIMQLNKIEHTFYPNESDPTQSHSEVWKRFVDEDGSQGLGISDLTYKIYAD